MFCLLRKARRLATYFFVLTGCRRAAAMASPSFGVSLFSNPQCVQLRLEGAPINYFWGSKVDL
jgi:hypothetical protein